MAGVTINELPPRSELSLLTAMTRNSDHFILDPIPNLYYRVSKLLED